MVEGCFELGLPLVYHLGYGDKDAPTVRGLRESGVGCRLLEKAFLNPKAIALTLNPNLNPKP